MKTTNNYAKSIELLNKAVNDELVAVHQYMYFHFHCDDQNLDLLASLFHRTAIAEMRHVEKLAERILFLGGDVDMKVTAGVKKVNDVKKMLEMAFKMEDDTVSDYNKFAIECGKNADAATKQIFEALVAEEELHRDQYNNEIDNLKLYGAQYLALQSMERSRNVASGKATE